MNRQDTQSPSPIETAFKEMDEPLSARRLMEQVVRHGASGVTAGNLPFSLYDTTAGSETELQAVVLGRKEDVDLAITIGGSRTFANLIRRRAAGELPHRALSDLERYIEENGEGVWENSWVRFPVALLGPCAREILSRDLLADKADPSRGPRGDGGDFLFPCGTEEYLRIPISYLLKLSLAEAIDGQPPVVAETGRQMLDHFLNDNTSPETFSFHVCTLTPENGMGRAVAGETAKRFLLTQLLLQYANGRFGLALRGQKAMAFYSPHPPIRQKRLNNCISDAFYREIFMNPCLSGWNRGEEKKAYMNLCHRVLSQSQLNALAMLREAGIITRNLVVLPNTSNVSLANNGTHISLGSRKLTALLKDPASGFTRRHEKYLGDLAIKITEHFLPLFVGTYSATPYRLDFKDFHPENVLGFLPHELDFTHLRMLWRRWQKKAKLNLCGRSVTPFGPPWLDRTLAAFFRLKGDFIPDFRLVDYLVALRSTETSPALDGTLQNHDRLKRDLAEMGVFDQRMSLYLFTKLREFHLMGFSGFEGRYYSLFPGFAEDMARAVDLQNLLNALAFKYMAEGRVEHVDIPDDPFVESERRQILFGRAVGIPTFFVRRDTQNRLLRRIVEKTDRVRASRRYPGYLRVHHREYALRLLQVLREDGADLIEMFQMVESMANLEARLANPGHESALGKITAGILSRAGEVASPLKLSAPVFNEAAERYYRNELRLKHLEEGLGVLEVDLERLSGTDCAEGAALRELLRAFTGRKIGAWLRGHFPMILQEKAPPALLERLIALLVLTVARDRHAAVGSSRRRPTMDRESGK